ncbi:MAG: FmdB family zinc ribbon protein [Opitutales bacterium]
MRRELSIFHDMPTYVYETVPSKSGEKPVRFELKQSMKDDPLTQHPKTGQRVRRIISGGYGFTGASERDAAADRCCGGGGCGCC